MKPVEVHRKTFKKMNQSTPKSFNPSRPLSWPLRSVSVAECRRLLNAPECGLLSCFCPLPEHSSPAIARFRPVCPGLKNSSQAPERFRFLRGLEEKKRVSPFFRILSLKRLSWYSKTFEHTLQKPLTEEPHTLHAHERPVVKRFLRRRSTLSR
jgi:hypothetical protein